MPTPSWIGHTLGGRYRIEDLLGQGGMSAVYKAADPNLRRAVAVKLIHSHLAADPEFVRRFEEEAAAVAQLRHPNIIQVFDFNHDADTYFMVLEYVQGETLHSKLKALNETQQRLPLAESIRIMAAICDAVHYAHQRGMIHRDLKPANVMINPQGQPILMDFGVAKILGGQQHTATGAVVGTPAYLSPEQARGDRPDSRADIYSLGVVLFEMLAGRPPFESDSGARLLLMHLQEPVPDIRKINADIPNDLAGAVEKALAKQAADRFQTAAEMANALRSVNLLSKAASTTAVETARPVAARKPPPPLKARTGDQLKKISRLWLGCGALVVVAIVIAAIGGAIGVSMFAGGTESTTAPTHVAANVTHAAATESAASTVIPVAATDTPHATPTLIPVPDVPDGMILIPAGFFKMGAADSRADESPEHPVLLNAYYVDRTEVTNGQYLECVNAGGCTRSGSSRVGVASFEKYPVVLVTWSQAQTYCEWAGKRLPSEAEWEYAASGPDNFAWPWGNSFDSRLSAAGAPDVQPAGSYPQGASPFGAMDMAGNAAEWVLDTYSQSFYASSPPANPFNSDDGATKIFRGGSFGNTDGSFYTTSRRYPKSRLFSDVDIGFRCAKDAHDVNAARPQAERASLAGTFCEAYLAYKPGAACP